MRGAIGFGLEDRAPAKARDVLTPGKCGFPASDTAEHNDSRQTMQSESACGLACTIEARYDLATRVDHLTLPVYLETGERVVKYWSGPGSMERWFLDLKHEGGLSEVRVFPKVDIGIVFSHSIFQRSGRNR